ncbi:MAG: aspartate-semialdehyde dehydrogenase [Bacteroidales bacterium]|nr:aspartate-semialdehyde dehydrogenase [Bacteroidales bacterium]
MKIAVVGATGMVGRVMLQVLEERGFANSDLIPVASTSGRKVYFAGRALETKTPEEALKLEPQIAIFSAGSSASTKYAPEFAKCGFVIDNSSAWRMFDHIPLVVPEINASDINPQTRIIANPNCSTIQMVLALWPLEVNYGIERIVVSTYQSVTGSGMKGLQQLLDERAGAEVRKFYPHPIDLNLIPHGGDFLDNGYTSEEMKLVNETRKILHNQEIAITATVVRVPVKGGHSESVNLRLKKEFALDDVVSLLSETSGLVVLDDPSTNSYPMPLFAEGRDEVFVGRIRRDFSEHNGLNMWIVADNLRKGAATNAIQIAQFLINHHI